MCAETAPVNIALRNLVERLFPAEYAAREAEAEEARRDQAAKLPLFCMTEPLMPNQVRPSRRKGLR
jgi:hypothetical protein